MMDADVLVVGAGPAGCLAAMTLARAGVRVRLLDRSTFPRDKVCGDTVSPGAMAVLERHGLGAAIRGCGEPITGMTITGPGGVRVIADYPPGVRGVGLRRHDLDLRLLEAAAAAGVVIETRVPVREPRLDGDGCRVAGVRVAVHAHLRDLAAPVVIATDGRASRLARALHLAAWAPWPRRWAFRAYYQDVAGMTGRGEMHIRAGGYIGLAAMPGGGVNVCVVREVAGRTPAAGTGHPLSGVVRNAVMADPLLADRFGAARQVSDMAAMGPLAVDARGAGCPGLLLAGDAAGFVDPMTGDGLHLALRGAELAAAAALRELETGAPAHAQLATARGREFGPRWWLNRSLRAVVGSPRTLEVAARAAAVWAGPVRYIVGVAAGYRGQALGSPP